MASGGGADLHDQHQLTGSTVLVVPM